MDKNKLIEVTVNKGWFGKSSVNKINSYVSDKYPDWQIVQVFSQPGIDKNIVTVLFYLLLGVITLGFVVKGDNYMILLEKI